MGSFSPMRSISELVCSSPQEGTYHRGRMSRLLRPSRTDVPKYRMQQHRWSTSAKAEGERDPSGRCKVAVAMQSPANARECGMNLTFERQSGRLGSSALILTGQASLVPCANRQMDADNMRRGELNSHHRIGHETSENIPMHTREVPR